MGCSYYHFKMNKLIFKLFYLKAASGLFFLAMALLLIGCASKITGKAIANEITKSPEVYFCPADDCGKALEMRISSANFSVYCALYDMDLKGVISSLAKKSKTADVRLVMDRSNYEGQVKGNVKLDNNERLMHNKFCIIDGRIVVTGSFNPTSNDNYNNNNNMLVVYSSILAKNYEDEFDELWNGEFGKGNRVKNPVLHVNNIKIENYFCPEDDCAFHVIGLIKNAESSVYFMAFSFTNEEIADALIKKNVEVRGIFDAQQSSSKFSQLKRMRDFGVNAKKDAGKYKMHHKVFIIDNKTVATGSFNPSLSADERNDENILIIHDKRIASAFLKEFDSLWQ